jgi:heterodisulfide reductase subunit B
MSSYSYFPGCSQGSSAHEYGESTLVVARELGIDLREIPDWSCCGASSGHMTNHLLSVALPARNLAIAKRDGLDITVVCAACYNRLRMSQKEILEDENLARKVEELVGGDPRYTGEVLHLLDVIFRHVDLDALKEKVAKPLEVLKPVSYYGCLMARPHGLMTEDNYENPERMDKLLGALGAEVKPWAYKTDCCGGSLSLTRTDVVVNLVNRLFEAAEEADANCIVTACPMCLANLEMRQAEGTLKFETPHPMPVFFFTELIALALGSPEADEWFPKHLIDPLPLLQGAGLL